MAKQRKIFLAIATALLAPYGATPATVLAVNTVYFSPSDIGVTKSVAEWGIDTAWPSYDNVRQSIQNMGVGNVDVVRLNFYPDQALVTNSGGTYALNATAKGYIDNQLSLAALAGTNKPLALLPTVGTTDGMYLSGSGINVANWAQMIKSTQEYINSKPGFTTARISSIEAFNEPDYWQGQGTRANLNSVIQTLKAYPVFQSTAMLAGSTLNSDAARSWYDQAPAATSGSSHLLGGSLTSYVAFMDYVKSTGKPFANPELHSLGEAIVGAEHGMTSGIWWGDALRARGLFVQASDGKRLGYAENLARQSAAAVYRAPDGKIRAFAGGLERFGRATAYRFVSTDKDVYFNGIPVREYMLQTKFDETNAVNPAGNDFDNYGSWSGQGAYADVELDNTGVPALDGYRWKLVNTQTGQVMEVAGSGAADGALIRSAADVSGLNQMWKIVRTRDGFYELFNANSGRTAEVANGSLNNGASVRQWGTADNQIQQWYIDPATNGSFYIRNAYSNKYLTSSTTNSIQYDLAVPGLQQWKFVLANPVLPSKAQYAFQGNVSSSTGANNGTAFGTPIYVAGPTGLGQAIKMDGVGNYVQLPSGVASSTDITVATWVKWDGGASWQRIFDFGNDTNSYMFLTPSSGDGTMRFAITTGGNDNEQILETSSLPTGQWVHLALTLGGNTGMLYVNGVPRVAGQILLDPAHVNSTLNYIGKSQFSDPLFKGMLDDFRIYDYALDPSQIGSLVPHAWNVDADGTWSTVANWTFGGAPNGAGHSARFDGPFSAVRTVTLDAPTSVGILNFNVASSIAISGTMPLTLDALTGSAVLNVTAGNHTIAAPLHFSDDASINVAANTSLGIANTLDGGAHRVTKAGVGALLVAQLRNVSLDVQAGTVRVAHHDVGSTVSGASKVTSVTIAAGATLDLTNNALAIDYSGVAAGSLLTDVRGHLAAGRILSSDALPGSSFAIGYADNVTLHHTTLQGLDVDETTVLLQLSLSGDADLSGDVGFDDLVALAQNYNGTGKFWSEGDFNYDGVADFDDLVSLAQNYGHSMFASEAAMVGNAFAADFALAQSLVPEPASVAALVGVFAAVSRRRPPPLLQ
jgi:hypothetical protein